MIRSLAAAAALAALLPAAQAVTLGFEGATTTGANRLLDVDGANAQGPSLIDYAGFDWVGMVVAKPLVSVGRPQRIVGFEVDPEDGPQPVLEAVDAGFHRSIVSGDTVAFTQSFGGATSLFAAVKARPGDVNFNAGSVWLTSGWRGDIDVTVRGLRDGNVVASWTSVVGDAAPVQAILGFTDIDELQFLSSGGTFKYPNGSATGSFFNPSNAFSTPVLVLDDLVVTPVPEPGEWLMMVAGLAMLAGVARRRAGTRRGGSAPA